MVEDFGTHISAYKISIVVNHSPWCDPNSVSLPQVMAPIYFHCLTYILRHTYRCLSKKNTALGTVVNYNTQFINSVL